MDKVSYALGLSLGQTLVRSGVTHLDFKVFTEGIKAVFQKTEPEISEEEASAALEEYFKKVGEKRDEQIKKAKAENLKLSEEYLKSNANKDGIVVTPSGLQYKVITEGDGKTPGPHDHVKCHYEGKLISGDVFDSSYQRGKPASFGLDQVIPGWTEGLQLMKVGSKYEFHISPELGYGEVGIPNHIPGNSVLIFTVELLDIE